MKDEHSKTVRIKRPSRVTQDARGNNVWVGRVDEIELELVSTMALQRVLKTGDDKTQAEIRKLAASRKDGVLARDTATGHYQIIGEAELNAVAAKEELSLVRTQILRKAVKGGGFDPYNKR